MPLFDEDTGSPANGTIGGTTAEAVVCSVSGPISALQEQFEMHQVQLKWCEASLKTHWNRSGLTGEMNPVALVARLRAVAQAMPKLIERQQRLAAEKAIVAAQVAQLVGHNQQLLHSLHTRAEQLSSHPPAGMPALSLPSDSPPKSASKKAARPSTAPVAPAPHVTPTSSPAPLTTRRKSMRPAQPPSPSTLVEAALLAQINSSSELEGPISEKEFAQVSTTVKSRVKLVDVNAMLSTIQSHFQRFVQTHKVKDTSALPPLTLHMLAEAGFKIGGASSQCILGTLRACKRVVVTKVGILLVRPPVWSPAHK